MTSIRRYFHSVPRHLRISFAQLVKQRKFDGIMDVLMKESDLENLHLWLQGQMPHSQANTSKSSEDLESTGETALHQIAAVQPPAWIVESLVDCLAAIYCNVPLDVTDSLGRTPLHIAVLHGSTEAIPFLANSSTAALIQDHYHRCPLHWACTHPIGYNTFQNNVTDAVTPMMCKLICHSRKVAMDMCDVVRILLEAYPEATLIRDADHRTPLEIAQYYNADPSIVRMIHHVEQAIRQERKSWCDWDQSRNGDTTSLTITESDSFLPQGFPIEISYHSRHVRYRPSDPSTYVRFEC